jgi:alkanesulfonate monooxygenase SsuD/methylene tetrahydromethanopterin reductase-like flavin-dependent oxidoreductase (luciferase family)
MHAGVVILPEYRWAEAEHKWRRAEEYGFHHAWTFDHLGFTPLVDRPWFGSVPTLTLAAYATSRIELGPLVASPNWRHPLPFARELTALDEISGGRITVGIGAGTGHGYDATVFGQNRPPSRSQRLAEFVELLDALLTRDGVSWQGDYYSAVNARNVPGCTQQPRTAFVIAANGPRAMALTARFGQGWVTTGEHSDDLQCWWGTVAELAHKFEEVLHAQGRRPDDIRRFLQTDGAPIYSLQSVECYRDFTGRAGELGFTDVVAPWPRREGIWSGSEDVLDTVAAQVLPELSGRAAMC